MARRPLDWHSLLFQWLPVSFFAGAFWLGLRSVVRALADESARMGWSLL